MADVSGLVIGAVALASLFTTCIELFDYFELGRNYAYDYQLACTKISLLKARLAGWGLSLNVGNPGHEHPSLRHHWPDEQDVVARSLFGVKNIFEDASLLAEKYKITPKRSRSFRIFDVHRHVEAGHSQPIERPSKVPWTGWIYLQKRTKWAIHDKQRFDRFTNDLSFLIENLEKVTERIIMPESNTKAKLILAPNMQNQNREASAQNAQAHGEQAQQDRTGHSYSGSQNNNNSFGVMGNVGPSDKRNTYTGNQSNTNNAFGVMGDVSTRDAARLDASRTTRV